MDSMGGREMTRGGAKILDVHRAIFYHEIGEESVSLDHSGSSHLPVPVHRDAIVIQRLPYMYMYVHVSASPRECSSNDGMGWDGIFSSPRHQVLYLSYTMHHVLSLTDRTIHD